MFFLSQSLWGMYTTSAPLEYAIFIKPFQVPSISILVVSADSFGVKSSRNDWVPRIRAILDPSGKYVKERRAFPFLSLDSWHKLHISNASFLKIIQSLTHTHHPSRVIREMAQSVSLPLYTTHRHVVVTR